MNPCVFIVLAFEWPPYSVTEFWLIGWEARLSQQGAVDVIFDTTVPYHAVTAVSKAGHCLLTAECIANLTAF